MFEINPQWAKFWLDFISTMAVFALFLYTWIDKKRKNNSQDIDQLQEKQTDLDSRVQKLENTQSLMATHEDVSAIKVQLEGLNQKISAVDHILKILHQHMLDKGDTK